MFASRFDDSKPLIVLIGGLGGEKWTRHRDEPVLDSEILETRVIPYGQTKLSSSSSLFSTYEVTLLPVTQTMPKLSATFHASQIIL